MTRGFGVLGFWGDSGYGLLVGCRVMVEAEVDQTVIVKNQRLARWCLDDNLKTNSDRVYSKTGGESNEGGMMYLQVGDNVCAIFERAEEIRRGKSIVDKQDQFVLVRDLGYFFKREDGDIGVAESLTVNNFCVRLNGRFKILRVAWVNKSDIDSQLGQGVGELVVRAAIQTG